MRKVLYSLTGTMLFTLLLSTQIGVTSCTKEVKVHDTTEVIVRDTVWKADILAKHINDSLWAYFPIQGSTRDSSGNNRTLELRNGATLTYDKAGNDNAALNFSGSNTHAVIADGRIFPSTSAFTVSLVVMPRQNSGLFFGKQDYSTAKAAAFNIGIDNVTSGSVARFSVTTNQSRLCDEIPAGGNLLLNTRSFNLNAWYHIIATFDKGTMKLYINGRLVNTRTIALQQINSCPNGAFILANWWAGDFNGFDGKMDDIRIYTRAISDTEAKYLYDKCSTHL